LLGASYDSRNLGTRPQSLRFFFLAISRKGIRLYPVKVIMKTNLDLINECDVYVNFFFALPPLGLTCRISCIKNICLAGTLRFNTDKCFYKASVLNLRNYRFFFPAIVVFLIEPLLTLHSFPYPDKDPQAHAAILKTIYTLVWDEVPIGYLPSSVVERLQQVPLSIRGEVEVNHSARTVSAFRQFPNEVERSKAVAATMAYWRDNKVFDVLAGWRNELYPVYGPGNKLLFSIERSASPLFGVVTYGVHMTAFVRDESASYGLKIWVPRRAKGKPTFPGMPTLLYQL
jgi:hypothetical protein